LTPQGAKATGQITNLKIPEKNFLAWRKESDISIGLIKVATNTHQEVE
jgi:hypothetical protein